MKEKVLLLLIFVCAFLVLPSCAELCVGTQNYTVTSSTEAYVQITPDYEGFPDDALNGMYIQVLTGAYAGSEFEILSNTDDSIVLSTVEHDVLEFPELYVATGSNAWEKTDTPERTDYTLKRSVPVSSIGWQNTKTVTGIHQYWIKNVSSASGGVGAGIYYGASMAGITYSDFEPHVTEVTGISKAPGWGAFTFFQAAAQNGKITDVWYVVADYASVDISEFAPGDIFRIFNAQTGEYYQECSEGVGNPDGNYEVIVHGTNTEPISGAEVTLYYDGTLQDTSTTGASGIIYYDVPLYRWVNGTVTKSGYQNATFSQYINYWDTWSSVTLYTDTETPGTGDEYWNYVVTFRDASTLATLTNVEIDVYTDSGRTDLFLSDNAPYGVWTGLLPNDTTYYFTASAANHVNATWSYTLSGASVSVYKDLIPVTYGSLQPVLNIFVYDTAGTPLNGVGVTVDSGTDNGFHLTNVTGYARHFCDNLAHGTSRNYTVTASKGGYVAETSTVTVSTQQPTVYIFMEKSTIATVTLTGIYTPVVTPIWSGDGGTPGNIKEQLINTLMTQFGLSQLEANILMGIVLTLLCAVTVGGALASYGSGSGAGVGAMIGAVVGFSGSSIIGFFPIWILIVVIVLVFAAWFMFRGRDE
jgi:hypothetical protein